MKSFKFYIGTKAGECAKDTRFEDWTFSKKQVVEAIEQNRQMYNILYGETMPIQGYFCIQSTDTGMVYKRLPLFWKL